jgi:hypothetical protein
LEIASADKVVLSTDLQEHTWNRLIEDFIGAYATTTRITRTTPASPPSTTAYAPKKSSMQPPVEQHWTLGNRWRMNER